MKKIVLDVKEENITTVLNILENLKAGLIDTISTDGKKIQNARYTPKTKEVVKEGSMPSGKYISKEEYRKRKSKFV